ncbi:Ty1/Copia family ribonuclease HI, partial [Lacticaseibacillus paracasei]
TTLSTAEAEYYSASTAATEVLYLCHLLDSMGFAQASPTPVYEDNTACIEWGNNVIGGRERAKHIDIRKHFAHEVI